MTPEERYDELYKITEGFRQKRRIHFHVLRTLREVRAENDAEKAQLWKLLNAVHSLSHPDGIVRGPLVDGPEMDELNKVLATLPKRAPEGV